MKPGTIILASYNFCSERLQLVKHGILFNFSLIKKMVSHSFLKIPLSVKWVLWLNSTHTRAVWQYVLVFNPPPASANLNTFQTLELVSFQSYYYFYHIEIGRKDILFSFILNLKNLIHLYVQKSEWAKKFWFFFYDFYNKILPCPRPLSPSTVTLPCPPSMSPLLQYQACKPHPACKWRCTITVHTTLPILPRKCQE